MKEISLWLESLDAIPAISFSI